MGKGTPSRGKHGGSKTHIKCRRCGRKSYNLSLKRCSACGYGETTSIRKYSWQVKNLHRERIR